MPSLSLAIPPVRLRVLRDQAPTRRARYVLYWMIAARRLEDNFGLQQACWWSNALDLPVLVFEPLRAGYPWASDRLHAFVLEGMAEHRTAAAEAGVTYFPYVEPTPGAGKGLLARLAEDAAVVVTDDYPTFFLPRMVSAAAQTIDCRFESVDSNGLMPMRATDTVYPTAYAFRRYLQKSLVPHLAAMPLRAPLAVLASERRTGSGAYDPVKAAGHTRQCALIHAEVLERWPAATDALLTASSDALATLPIDHTVTPSPVLRGGATAAHDRLAHFLAHGLPVYHEARSQPDSDAASGLSPWLHFGHIATQRVFDAVMTQAGWTTRKIAAQASGKREGWWGAAPAVEAFLDELVTWREVGFNFAALRPDHDRYESLPDWARASLEAHASDRREHLYTLEEFDRAETHDPVWNAAQRQIVREGRMHNYLRMLWGKKILQWTRTPREALDVMIQLNNRYGLDGRDPNSYSGIFWVLGRYDRPWAPRREVFGVIRYMSSDSTVKKLRLKRYLQEYGAPIADEASGPARPRERARQTPAKTRSAGRLF